jgi:hypothetical protein
MLVVRLREVARAVPPTTSSTTICCPRLPPQAMEYAATSMPQAIGWFAAWCTWL